MCLDIRVLDSDNNEIDLKATFDDEDDVIPPPVSGAEDFDELTAQGSQYDESDLENGDLDEGFSLADDEDDDDDYGLSDDDDEGSDDDYLLDDSDDGDDDLI